jgi:hypothetical protein
MDRQPDGFLEISWEQIYEFSPETCPHHPPASSLKACACRSCGAWVWEGVTMCRNLVVDAGGEKACTRRAGHEGRCEERELRGGQEPQ